MELASIDVMSNTHIQVKRPSEYRIDILNDDVTPFLVVIYVLNKVFQKDVEDSTKIAENAHLHGSALVGIYSHDVAKTYMAQATEVIDELKVPLRLKMTKVED